MKKAIILAGLAVLAFEAANAETPAARGTVGRDAAVTMILENNPRLKALAENQKAESTQLSVAGRFNNQPEVEFEHMWGKGGVTKWNAGVTQSFDWPGVYGRRREEAQARMGAFRYLYAAEARSIATEAMLLFDNAVYVQKQIALLDKLIANLKQLQEKVAVAHKGGQVTVLDVKKLDFEMYTYNARRNDLLQEQDRLAGELAALNGGKTIDADFSGFVPQALQPLDEYLRLARENNPTVKAAEQNAEAARMAARTADAERKPGFAVGYRHAYEEQIHFNGFSVSVSLPVFTNKAASLAAQTRVTALGFEAESVAGAEQAKVRATYADATRRAAALREMSKVTLDESYPRLVLMAYNGGQINVITYLQEISYFESAQAEYLAAEYSYYTDLTTLNALARPL